MVNQQYNSQLYCNPYLNVRFADKHRYTATQPEDGKTTARGRLHPARPGTRLYGATTLARPVLLWPFLALPILMLVHFEEDLFGANFMEINFFLLLFVSIFLIYKKIFRLFFIFFSKTVERFFVYLY